MKSVRALLRAIVHAIHLRVSRRAWAATLYLRVFGLVVRRLPESHWKKRLLNSIYTIPWPPVRLAPVDVELMPGISARMIPHPDGPTFEAHLGRRLNYEAEVFEWLRTRQYDSVIEIGANIGLYTLFFSKVFPQASIYAFEPAAEPYRRLKSNLDLNNPSNVQLFHCAVSNQSGFCDFFESGHLSNGSLVRSFAASFAPVLRSTKVPMLSASTLEQLVRPAGSVLIKIDAEGSEPFILDAMHEIIARHRPDLLIEVLDATSSDLNSLSFLLDGRYQIYQLTTGGPVLKHRFEAGVFREYCLLPVDSNQNH